MAKFVEKFTEFTKVVEIKGMSLMKQMSTADNFLKNLEALITLHKTLFANNVFGIK